MCGNEYCFQTDKHGQENLMDNFKRIKKLPDFIIGGAQKCGTTSLHFYLAQHKDIFMPMKKQETHFFDHDQNYHKGVEWYERCFKDHKNERVIGQTSPLYLYMENVPDRIYRLLPKVKLMFILRNPVDRAYSHYWHEKKKGREKVTFEEAIEIEGERINKDFWHNQHFSYLSRGKYVEQIERYLEFFSPSQLLFIMFDEFKKDPLDTVKRCFNFLRVSPSQEIDVSEKYNQTIIGNYIFLRRFIINRFTLKKPLKDFFVKLDHKQINKRVGYPEMNIETRKTLEKYFRPYNQKLQKVLDLPRSL
jgi:hypothetical protein